MQSKRSIPKSKPVAKPVLPLVTTRPALAGSANCQAVIGAPWKHVRTHAVERGVPILRIGRKDFVEVDAYLAAVKTGTTNAGSGKGSDAVDAAETVRSILRKAGGQ